jgi:1-phosphofructokinase family hexose kinase
MIFSVTLNPCIDVSLFVDGLKPHDTNRIQRQEIDAGGKGLNLSRVAAELGAQTTASGFLGGSPGAQVRTVLEAQGVGMDFVSCAAETRMNFSVEGGKGKPPTTFNARGGPITQSEWEQMLSVMERQAAGSEWVALGGSIPLGLPRDAYLTLGQIAKSAGCKLLLDADRDAIQHGLGAAPDLIKPNLHEAERLLDRRIDGFDEALRSCRGLFELLLSKGSENPTAILSLGADGAILCSGSETLFAKPIKLKPVSTIGSGDSLLGGYLAGLQQGMLVSEAFRLGSAAGAATALTDGAEIARKPVVLRLLEQAEVEVVS